MAGKKIVIIIIIGLALSLIINVPKSNAAAVVTDPLNAGINGITAGNSTALTVKEYVLDPIGRAIARSLLNVAISGIINKIQTGGRDGGPAFVQNWSNFQTGAQYRGENVFRSMLSATTLCNYTSASIKGLFGANQKISSSGQNLRTDNFDSFTLRSNCTMPSNFNLQNYQNDFAGNGGWNAWSRMLEPQNNYYGLLFGSLDESAKQRALAQSSDVYEATAGSGYTSVRSSCAGKGPNAKCVFLGKIFTPGDLLGKSAASTIDSDLGWLVSSDELSEVIIAIGTAITNRIINLAADNPSDDYKNTPKADTSSSDGYLACINSCPAADNLTCQTNCAKAFPNGGYNTPQASSTPPPTNGESVLPPADASTKHGNHQAEVAEAKSDLESQGVSLTGSCGAFEIVKEAASRIGGGAGFLDKPAGNNCQGFAVDIIAYPDGYIYDVLGDAGGANNPQWSPSACGTVATNGTCPDRYRVAP